MKKTFLLSCILLFVILAQTSKADTFFDDFNDGNTDGWISAPPASWYGLGDWRLENNMLIQDKGGDHYKFLVDNLQIADQSVEAKIYTFGPSGYGGITVWYHDYDNWIDVLVYPAAGVNGLWILEVINGNAVLTQYPYASGESVWHNIKVDTNSTTGQLTVYMDDEYIVTHQISVNFRTGLTGLNSGNAGGYFDDFRLTSDGVGSKAPVNKNDCKNDNWKQWLDPVFKNQGACVSYIESNERAGKRD